jgi:hypothetical protein
VTATEKWVLWISSLLTGVSGLVYAWMKYLMQGPDPYAVIHHPLQPAVLKIHILVAPVLVFSAGAIFFKHAIRHWRLGRREGRLSGIATTLVLAPMIVSGYAIQTLTSTSWLFALAMIHLAVGAVYLVVLVAHRVGAPGRRVRQYGDAALPSGGDGDELGPG